MNSLIWGRALASTSPQARVGIKQSLLLWMMTALASLSLSPGITFTWTGQEELIRWKKGETTLSLSPQESQIWPIWKVKENQSLVTRPNHNKQTKHHLKRARETSDQAKPIDDMKGTDPAITVMSLSPQERLFCEWWQPRHHPGRPWAVPSYDQRDWS